MKNKFLYFFALTAFFSCGKKEMVINGTFNLEEKYPFEFVYIQDKQGALLDSIGVADNAFTLTVPTQKNPFFATIKIGRKGMPTKNRDIIVYPSTVEFKGVVANNPMGKDYILTDNGGYNDLIINEWEQIDEMKEKFNEFFVNANENKKEYFSSKTPIDRKMEIRAVYDDLEYKYKNVKNTHLAKQMSNKDLLVRAMAINYMGVNSYNYQFVPDVVAKYNNIQWVKDLENDYNKYLDLEVHKARVAIGEKSMDILGNFEDVKGLKLSDTYKSSKLTMLLFIGSDYDSSSYLPIIKDIYEEQKENGFNLFTVWVGDNYQENLAKLREKTEFDLPVLTNTDNSEKVIDWYMAEKPIQLYLLNTNGEIVGHISHRYSLSKKIESLLK